MGLKKSNYTVKELGITVNEAYAIIHALSVRGNRGSAEFYIQGSRENAFNLKPLERKFLDFTVNRNENPYTTAYTVAKGVIKEEVVKINEETGEPYNDIETTENIFYGWEDDILTD